MASIARSPRVRCAEQRGGRIEYGIRRVVTSSSDEQLVRGDRPGSDAPGVEGAGRNLARIEIGDLRIGDRRVGYLSRRYGGIGYLRVFDSGIRYLGRSDASVDDLRRAYRRVRDDARRGSQCSGYHVRRCDSSRSDLRASNRSSLNPVGVHVA